MDFANVVRVCTGDGEKMTDASRSQVRLWGRARRYAAALNKMVNACVAMGENITDGVRIARANGIDLPQSVAYISDIQQLQAVDSRIQRIIEGVELGNLGIRTCIHRSNDLDVMANNDDEAGQYLSGISLIIIGAVVVYGIITVTYSQFQRAQRITKAYESNNAYVDNILCSVPGSTQCTAWDAQKRSVAHLERKSWWEDMIEMANRLTRNVVTGSKWGVMIAIPMIVWLLASKLGDRRD